MNTSDFIREKIRASKNDKVITFQDFFDAPNPRAVAMTLSRLAKAGSLKKLGKGKYFVPRKTKFGTIGPSDAEIIKTILGTEGDRYISGPSVFNALGLTTQVPSQITIIGDRYNRKVEIGKLRIVYLRANFPIRGKKISLLQLLDALKEIEAIPDTNTSQILYLLKNKILKLKKNDIKELVSLALLYPPRVRALLGAILEEINIYDLSTLKMSLNPLSFYKFKVNSDILPFKLNWNIK